MKPQKILISTLLVGAIFFNNNIFASQENDFIIVPDYTIEADFGIENNYQQNDKVVYPKVETSREEKEITELSKTEQKDETCQEKKKLLSSKDIKLFSGMAALGILLAVILKIKI